MVNVQLEQFCIIQILIQTKIHRVQIPKRERDRIRNSTVAPLYTPTMAGGLYSIDKEFFYEIGSYDDGMIIWGSENLEMSFRVKSR